MCLQPTITTSLAVPWDSSNFFPLTAPIEFPTSKRQRRDWSLHLYCHHASYFSPSINIISKIPTVKACKIEFWTTYPNFIKIQRLTKLVSLFYRNSSGFLWERKILQCEGYFSYLRHDIEIPTVRMLGIGLRTWCSNFTTIQRWMSRRSSFFSEIGLVGYENKKGFWKEKGKNENEAKRKHLT